MLCYIDYSGFLPDRCVKFEVLFNMCLIGNNNDDDDDRNKSALTFIQYIYIIL